jgi:hypothetical protein
MYLCLSPNIFESINSFALNKYVHRATRDRHQYNSSFNFIASMMPARKLCKLPGLEQNYPLLIQYLEIWYGIRY